MVGIKKLNPKKTAFFGVSKLKISPKNVFPLTGIKLRLLAIYHHFSYIKFSIYYPYKIHISLTQF